MKPPPQDPPLRSQLLSPALIILSAPFPLGCVSLAGGKASLASPFPPSHRPSFQTRPPVHWDPRRSPGSRWAGTSMTNSAQGVDSPSRPGLWLASHLRQRLSQTPARAPGLGARDCAPKPPTRRCPALQLRKEAPQRARCHVGTGSRDVQLPARPERGPPSAPSPGQAGRRGTERCAPSSRRDRGHPPLASGSPCLLKASRAGLSPDRPSLTL